MGKPFGRSIVRLIGSSWGRFFAIALISALGTGFFGALRMTEPDMRASADRYFDATNLYDIRVASSTGLTQQQIDRLKDIQGVQAVMPERSQDALVDIDGNQYTVAIRSLDTDAAAASDTSSGDRARSDNDAYINRPVLVKGTWPQQANECVVSADALTDGTISIGDTLTITSGTSTLDATMATKTFKITGFVRSSYYAERISMDVTSLGDGNLSQFVYAPDSAFVQQPPYTEAFITVKGASAQLWDTAAYSDCVQPVIDRIEQDEPALTALGSSQTEWYVLGRDANYGAASYSSDAARIGQIGLVFPLVFLLVAALVSLTTMTRMVEEERVVMGTLKALGYSPAHIALRYLLYAAVASGTGALVGIVSLTQFLPRFVMNAYGIMYDIPVMLTEIDPAVAALSVGVGVGITLVATAIAAASALRERPASLMLPRAPKAGQRIVLERITPLWRRLSFSWKVTARNIFRYKRRFFMAVVGVAGCCALLLCGLGLRDSINDIVTKQFDQVFSYNLLVNLKPQQETTSPEVPNELLDHSEVASYTLAASSSRVVRSSSGDEDWRVNMVVPQDPAAFSFYVHIAERTSQKEISLTGDAVVLTEKAATKLGVGVGDTIKVFAEDSMGKATGKGVSLTVSGIAENYVNHYLYLTPAAYRKAFGTDPVYTTVYAKTSKSLTGTTRDEFSDALLDTPDVLTVQFNDEMIDTYRTMLSTVNSVVVVLLVAAALLAFVVLYNLTNINITERTREIATLKVLGFTRREVGAYIFREVMLLSLIGAVVGEVFGVVLERFVVQTAEVDTVMFGRSIHLLSFVIAFVLTMVFSGVVSVAMRRRLHSIDMVESLKSVE